MSHPAVFLDRDDTLVEDPGFIDDPAKVELVPGAAEAVRRLRNAGYKVVVASNQSGVARGLFDEDRLAAIHARLRELLAQGEATLDGIYYCPYLDGEGAKVEAYRKDSELRKPAPGMLLRAAEDLDLDLPRSWKIGDSARDIEAGQRAGCRTILIERPRRVPENEGVQPSHRVRSLIEAVEMVERENAQSAPKSPSVVDDGFGEPGPVELLREIRDLLDRQQRAAQQEDFSLRRMVATLGQMLVIVVGLWGLLAMFQGTAAEALTRFGLAGLLQLITMTLTFGRRR